ncbi:GDSL-type esterase/lipase family protein [Leptolyngbya sp. FACHB-8]|uniref:SGNH/GDSL hydrolase family protein n=1 Tax=unclassified Leptolyngbya TaxID=2650499 RepID=UPI0016873914|nr:GDSL-type esterase/lipase family protein [Leptolyngbya sp. FACHB-8]MBD1914051.1 SGNH/GDSL hydrolase family protein [Leptolyngbya sp. FACHB-8]
MKLSKLSILWNALILLVLGSLAFLNVVLFNQAKKYYLEVNQTRLDPLGLNYYPVDFEGTADQPEPRVVFLGDSRAENWPPPDINGYEFVNRGISSQTSTQVVQRFSPHVRSLNPDIVIIQVGVNDLKTVTLFPKSRESIVHNTKANIERIVNESHSLGAAVIVTTIFPVGEVPLQRRPFWSDDISQAIDDVNAYIKTLADEQTVVFDTFPLLADGRGVLRAEYRSDELHLNAQGYAVLNAELSKLINLRSFQK